MPPAPVTLADGRSLPGDLPGILQGAMAGRLSLVAELLNAGFSDTRSVLETPLERWRYVKGFSSPAFAALQRTMRERWGVELGCLAPGEVAPGALPTGGLAAPAAPTSTRAASIALGAPKTYVAPVVPASLLKKENANANR